MSYANLKEIIKLNKTTILHGALAAYVTITMAMIIAGIAHCKSDMEKGSILINVGIIMSTLLSLSHVLAGLIQKMTKTEPESQRMDNIEKKLDTILETVNNNHNKTQSI